MKEQIVTVPKAAPVSAPAAAEHKAGNLHKVAGPARLRSRHRGLALFFSVWVLLPLLVAVFYLYAIALDQYESRVGFSVRKEEASSAVELLGGITQLSGSSSKDTDILFEFIQSREMIRAVDDKLDLSSIYVRSGDPVFSLTDNPSIEELQHYWNRVVDVFYDSSSGLIEIRVLAFAPQDAHNITQAIFTESSRMLNQLSAIARDDTTRYAREELDRASEQLKEARQALTAFRTRTQIVDPAADIQGRMGLLTTLQTQLAAALIELDLLLTSANDGDPRVAQAQKKVVVIQDRIEAERDRFSNAQSAEIDPYSSLVSEYEALAVDLEFAQNSYLSARATYDGALAEAQRKSRYLATYVAPTLAETAEFPQRLVLLFLIGSFLFVSWSIITLIYYSLRDRR